MFFSGMKQVKIFINELLDHLLNWFIQNTDSSRNETSELFIL